MMMLCSIKNADKSFKEIKDGIVNSGKEVDMEVWVQRKEISLTICTQFSEFNLEAALRTDIIKAAHFSYFSRMRAGFYERF